jgi:hypothetical protein
MSDKKNGTPFRVIDARGEMDPDESFAVPNDLIDKYARLICVGKNPELWDAVMDLIRQTWRFGLEYGRNESPIYLLIPSVVAADKTLNNTEKLLFAAITGLAKRGGYCYASNIYLANCIGCDKRTIGGPLKNLKDRGLIRVDIERGKHGTHRKIYPKIHIGGYAGKRGGVRKDAQGGYSNSRSHDIKEQSIKEEDKKKDAGIETAPAQKPAGVDNSPKNLRVKDVDPGSPKTPQAEFVENWAGLYENETGRPYKADRKDFIVAAKLIGEFGMGETTLRAKLLFQACKDRAAWFTKGGMADFTIGKLSARFNEIIPGALKTKGQAAYEEALARVV